MAFGVLDIWLYEFENSVDMGINSDFVIDKQERSGICDRLCLVK